MKKTIQLTTRILLAMAVIVTMLGAQKEEVCAEVDRSVALYEWHRVQSVDELKAAEYMNKWVPIIIVADYEAGDKYSSVSYYLNRETPISYTKRTYTEIAFMNKLDDSTNTGKLLRIGLKELEAGATTFVTRGDMGAMHMYYHGFCSKNVGKNDTLQADAWSLTNDKNVEDYSNVAVNQVYGLAIYTSYIEIDQNKMVTWREKELPTTQSERTTKHVTTQAWTFLNDTSDGSANGYFKICNVFGVEDDQDRIKYAYAPTWGAPVEGSYRYNDIDVTCRHMISTPSRAAAYTANGSTNYLGPDLNRAILAQYNKKYDKNYLRAKYSIYIGKQMDGDYEVKGQNVSGKLTVSNGSVINEGSDIHIKKGGLVYIAADSKVFFDGKIILEGGTLIVGNGAVVSTSKMYGLSQNVSGCIEDSGKDRSKLLVMDDATLCLASELSLQNTDVVNQGLIVVPGLAKFAGTSTVQMGGDSRLAAGYAAKNPNLLAVTLKDMKAKGDFEDNPSNIEPKGVYYTTPNSDTSIHLKIGENASVVLEGDQSKIFHSFAILEGSNISSSTATGGTVQYADTSGNISKAKMTDKPYTSIKYDLYGNKALNHHPTVYSGK